MRVRLNIEFLIKYDLRISLKLARFHPPQSPLIKGGSRRQGGKCEQISDNRVSPIKVEVKLWSPLQVPSYKTYQNLPIVQ